mgnify:CR=1 FL=1
MTYSASVQSVQDTQEPLSTGYIFRTLVSSVLTQGSLQLQQFQTRLVVVKQGIVHLDDSQLLGPVSLAYS